MDPFFASEELPRVPDEARAAPSQKDTGRLCSEYEIEES